MKYLGHLLVTVMILGTTLTSCNKNKDDVVIFTVSFNSNEGSAVPSQTVKKGETTTKPDDPQRSQYVFVAWYKEVELTNEWKFDIDVVTADVTLYAKWELKQMTMTTAIAEIWFSMEGTGTTIVDWGDGSPQRILTVEDMDRSWMEFSHKYSSETMHTITITCDNVWSMQNTHNQLETLNVSKNPALRELWCFHNRLTFLNVNGLINLENLDCQSNPLMSIDISGLTKLKQLNCSNNQLSSLNLSGLDNMDWMICSGNRLTSIINAGDLTKLRHMDIGRNHMNSTALNNLFSSLPTVASGSINIYDNGPNYDGSGTNGCDVAIAEKKGWYVWSGD